jgi:hypothetical protein
LTDQKMSRETDAGEIADPAHLGLTLGEQLLDGRVPGPPGFR